nr:MAG TPA: hypothetical protein [Caudoviricetes sp.]
MKKRSKKENTNKKFTIEVTDNNDIFVTTNNINTSREMFEILGQIQYHVYNVSSKLS